jgi:hypothetical protein
VPEPANKFDQNAVAVFVKGKKVAYLARQHAAEYQNVLRSYKVGVEKINCKAIIVGGWDRGGDDRGHFGIKLDLGWPPQK